MVGITDASAGNFSFSSQETSPFVQDTHPRQKKDTMKWNKKKYPDSTRRTKRDSVPQ
jgi:hypothetical protein